MLYGTKKVPTLMQAQEKKREGNNTPWKGLYDEVCCFCKEGVWGGVGFNKAMHKKSPPLSAPLRTVFG